MKRNLLDDFLSFGSSFDWLTPLWAFIQDAHFGSPSQINISNDCGMSASQIEKQLNKVGVRTWGVLVVGRTITLTVRKPQARYARYWLQRWGIL